MQFTKHIQDNLPSEIALRLYPLFKQAAKLSSNNDEEAYLLGILIKKARQENRIDDYFEDLVRKAAERHSASSFYSLKSKPHFDNWYEFALIAAIFGLLGIIYGIIAVRNDFYTVTFNYAYFVHVIKGGGYMILLGLVMFIGGLSKTMQERRRKRLVNAFGKAANRVDGLTACKR